MVQAMLMKHFLKAITEVSAKMCCDLSEAAPTAMGRESS